MTKGWMNSTANSNHAMQNLPYADDPVETVLDVAETAASEQDVSLYTSSNRETNVVAPTPDSWRDEVAARVQRYRARRKPRPPRYPSLLLPFDTPEEQAQAASPTHSTVTEPAVSLAAPRQTQECQLSEGQTSEVCLIEEPRIFEREPLPSPESVQEPSAKVIEFPHPAAIPALHTSELADPVFDLDRPRIVEAPELLPPPPALGGLLIEPADPEPSGEQAGSPTAIQSAPLARRALAAFVDAVIVATALACFAAISFRLNPSLNLSLVPVRGSLPHFAGSISAGPAFALALGFVAVILWTAFQCLFVAYIGTTPGLRAARLRLAASDGSPLHRRARCWRVVASLLCVFSAGLGYLWCLLDQDGLCWHDRITRTYVQSM
jgi:uncharacterized RDD family membrane protein YckC